MKIEFVRAYLLDLQNRLCAFLEKEENGIRFNEDQWQHGEGGGGITRVLAEGVVIEKGGVNFSHVFGKRLPEAASKRYPALTNTSFQALGVSLVIHPRNPYAPTCHFNVRYIVPESGDGWFGGGFDLTPYYGFVEDCVHWHQTAKIACDSFGEDVYSNYKAWADRYFFLKHRNEPRGIGGIFFDDLSLSHADGWHFDRGFDFIQRVGEHFITAYQPILMRRKEHLYSERERNFQLYRRGRYVEFNLLYDRGTLFGLQSGGRVESILMSLPALVSWPYHYDTEPNSPEARLLEDFLKPKEWSALSFHQKI